MKAEDVKNTPDSHNEETPNLTKVFSGSQLETQLVLTLSLVNLLLLAAIIALIVKLGWMGLIALVAFF